MPRLLTALTLIWFVFITLPAMAADEEPPQADSQVASVEDIPGFQVFTALGISVVAGVIVIALSLLVRLIWHWWLENIYLKLTCRHLADISGAWEASYDLEGGWKCKDKTTLRQSGYKLEGESVMTMTKDTEKEVRKFTIIGILRNDLFSGYYYNQNRRQKGSGSFTYIVNGAGHLDGKGVFYDVTSDELWAVDYTLEPTKS